MRAIKRILICIIFIILPFAGCAANNNEDNKVHQLQKTNQENKESETMKVKRAPENFVESEPEPVPDFYEPVAVAQLDYDSFRDRMTEEEWAGFEQYFPILKENAAFSLTNFGNYDELNKDGEIAKEGEPVLFYRYTPEKMTDIAAYVTAYSDSGIEEMMIREVRVLDLDGDGIQELILEWTPVGDLLILHRENEEFYAWEIMYRGFEMLQTNGVFVGSGGAGSNSWYILRFANGIWLQEKLAEEDWGEYYLHGEAVDENTFLQQIDDYVTEDVTEYQPKRRADE